MQSEVRQAASTPLFAINATKTAIMCCFTKIVCFAKRQSCLSIRIVGSFALYGSLTNLNGHYRLFQLNVCLQNQCESTANKERQLKSANRFRFPLLRVLRVHLTVDLLTYNLFYVYIFDLKRLTTRLCIDTNQTGKAGVQKSVAALGTRFGAHSYSLILHYFLQSSTANTK